MDTEQLLIHVQTDQAELVIDDHGVLAFGASEAVQRLLASLEVPSSESTGSPLRPGLVSGLAAMNASARSVNGPVSEAAANTVMRSPPSVPALLDPHDVVATANAAVTARRNGSGRCERIGMKTSQPLTKRRTSDGNE